MDRPNDKRSVNPFALALLGIGLMLAGYAAMTYRFETEDDRRRAMLRAGADQREKTDKQAADALREAAGPLPTPQWFLLGRLVFWSGFAVIVAACVVWYRQAQRPAAEEEETDPIESTAEEG